MTKGQFYTALMALTLSVPVAACAHQGTAMECSVIGLEHWVRNATAEQICARFIGKLGPTEGRIAKITLTVSPRGSIRADVIDRDGHAHDVTRDVMDRPLRESDLDRLAADVAAILQA